MSFQVFNWRGKPIPDIYAWTAERGEKMIHYRLTTRTPYGPEVTEGYMPESFWNGLLWHGNETYEELRRETL